MDHGNPMRIAGGGASAREGGSEGGSEADDVQRYIASAGRIGSIVFEEEKGENSMNPIVVYAAEIKEKRDEKRRSLQVVEGV